MIPKNKRIFEPEKRQLEKLYHEGLSDRQIGKKLGVSTTTIRTTRNKMGLKTKHTFGYPPFKPSKYDLKTIWEMYHDLEPINTIAKKMKISPRIIRDYFKSWGMETGRVRGHLKRTLPFQERLLMLLEKFGPTSINALSIIYGKSSNKIGYSLRELEFLGFIERFKFSIGRTGSSNRPPDEIYGKVAFMSVGQIWGIVDDERIIGVILDAVEWKADQLKVIKKYYRSKIGLDRVEVLINCVKRLIANQDPKKSKEKKNEYQ